MKRAPLKKRSNKSNGGDASRLDRLLRDVRITIQAHQDEESCDTDLQPSMLYWQIGKVIRNELRNLSGAKHHRQFISTLSQRLMNEYGPCYAKTNLERIVRFGERFSDSRAASLLAKNLTWRHFQELIPIANPLKRHFYAEMCAREGWSHEELKDQIRSMLFERASIKSNHNDTAAQRLLTSLNQQWAPTSTFIFDDSDSIES